MHYRRSLLPWFTVLTLGTVVAACTSRPSGGCKASLTCSLPPQSGGGGEGGVAGASSTGGSAEGGSGGQGGDGGTTQAAAQLTVAVKPILRVLSLTTLTVDVEVERNGNADKLGIAVTGLPAGVVGADSSIPSDSSAGKATIQVNSASVLGGPYPVTITVTSAQDSTLTAEARVSLYVTGEPGQLDVSFGNAASVNTEVSASGGDVPAEVAVDDQGRTLLVGAGKNAFDVTQAWVARLTAKGELDTTFGGTGKVFGFGNGPSYAQQVVQTSHGLFVWATAAVRFIRAFDASGGVVSAFATGGDLVTAALGAPTELVAFGDGLLALTDSSLQPFAIAKNGTVDSTFSAPTGINASVMTVDGQQRVLYGAVRADSFAVGRLSSTGSADASFGVNGVVTVPFATGAQSNSFVKLTVDPTYNAYALVQAKTGATENDTKVSVFGFTAGGAVNSAFGTLGTLSVPIVDGVAKAYGAAVQSDGKVIVLYGDWNAGSQKSLSRLARYDATGKLDPTFASAGVLDLSTVGSGVTVRGMTYDPYGNRVVVCGSTAEGVTVLRVWL